MFVRLLGWTAKAQNMTDADPRGMKTPAEVVQAEEDRIKCPESLALTIIV